MIVPNVHPLHSSLIVAALVIGLAADVRTDIVGQTIIAVLVWVLLLCFLARLPCATRYCLMACLTIATIGELVLSLAWGLYTYRLGNIPLFVPPGHVFLLLLGAAAAERISEKQAGVVVAGAGLYAAVAAAAGIDTFALLLLVVITAAWFTLPAHRRLYASTFLVSLAMELYGTWLGNWSWAREVPGIPFVTTNPPGTVGAFYCALDVLVILATFMILPNLRRRAAPVTSTKAV